MKLSLKKQTDSVCTMFSVILLMFVFFTFFFLSSCAKKNVVTFPENISTPAFSETSGYATFDFYLYHCVVSDLSDDMDRGLYCSEKQFENDIITLLDSGKKPLSFEDFAAGKYDKECSYFLFSFDDGYLNNYEIAYPLLKKHGVPAAIFINTDNINLSHHFSYAQASEMEKSGLVMIYSHFPSHCDLRLLTDDEIANGFLRSYEEINSALGNERSMLFSYPYSYYDERTYGVLKNAGALYQFIQFKSFDSSDPSIVIRKIAFHDNSDDDFND